MDVMKDEAEVANREQDVSIAKSTLKFQELLIKNALTKNLDDPILEAMPVKPVNISTDDGTTAPAGAATEHVVAQALVASRGSGDLGDRSTEPRYQPKGCE